MLAIRWGLQSVLCPCAPASGSYNPAFSLLGRRLFSELCLRPTAAATTRHTQPENRASTPTPHPPTLPTHTHFAPSLQRDALRARHRQLLKSHHESFHHIWGQLMKTGYQNSRYAHQIEVRSARCLLCCAVLGAWLCNWMRVR